jgi:phospholipid/cholesterol/gamma-HCH transport system substrate-binding protein
VLGINFKRSGYAECRVKHHGRSGRKGCNMRRGNATKQVKLGIFIVVGMLLFTGCLYYMGSVRHMFQGTFEVSAVFRNAKGLQPGNNVTFSGINVGTVERIEIITDSTVRVFFVIEKATQKFIRKDAEAKIISDGLMGDKIISITGGTPGIAMVAEGDEIRANDGIGIDDVMKRFNTAGKNTEDITRNVALIVSDVNEGKGTLGALLKDTAFAQQFREAVLNLQSGSEEFNRILSKVRGEMVDNLAVTSKNAAEASKNLNQITSTARDSILRDLRKISSDAAMITGKLQQSEGTVGKLLNDTAFASSVEQAIRKVNTGADELTQVAQAAKSSWLLKGYFKKKERGENKKPVKQDELVFPE